MRIAIVDDCENERNELCKRLSQSSFSMSYDIEICGYGNGTDFLNEAMQNRFDLVFMDIYMEKENGIDAAQKLRKFDKDCLLVFTTTSTDHALDGFPNAAGNAGGMAAMAVVKDKNGLHECLLRTLRRSSGARFPSRR